MTTDTIEIGGHEFRLNRTLTDLDREIDQRYAALDPRDKLTMAEILEHQAKILRALAGHELESMDGAVAR